MDGELLSSPSDLGKNEGGKTALSYTKTFEEVCPYYMAIGMTYEQFWEGDCQLVRYYRKAEEIRVSRNNQEAWLQGMYIYDAIARLSPILRAFSKKGAKAEPYVDAPYPIGAKETETAEERREKARSEKAMRFMEAFTISNNKRFVSEENAHV